MVSLINHYVALISRLQIATDVTDMGSRSTSQEAATDESDTKHNEHNPWYNASQWRSLCSWDITYSPICNPHFWHSGFWGTLVTNEVNKNMSNKFVGQEGSLGVTAPCPSVATCLSMCVRVCLQKVVFLVTKYGDILVVLVVLYDAGLALQKRENITVYVVNYCWSLN